MARLNVERQKDIEPKRMEYAEKALSNLGYSLFIEEKSLYFFYNANKITLFPYSGWFSGKGIVAGRGIEKLLKQLKPNV